MGRKIQEIQQMQMSQMQPEFGQANGLDMSMNGQENIMDALRKKGNPGSAANVLPQ